MLLLMQCACSVVACLAPARVQRAAALHRAQARMLLLMQCAFSVIACSGLRLRKYNELPHYTAHRRACACSRGAHASEIAWLCLSLCVAMKLLIITQFGMYGPGHAWQQQRTSLWQHPHVLLLSTMQVPLMHVCA